MLPLILSECPYKKGFSIREGSSSFTFMSPNSLNESSITLRFAVKCGEWKLARLLERTSELDKGTILGQNWGQFCLLREGIPESGSNNVLSCVAPSVPVRMVRLKERAISLAPIILTPMQAHKGKYVFWDSSSHLGFYKLKPAV